MTRFTAIDLSALDPPNVIEEIDFEAILEQLKVDCVARLIESDVDYDVEKLESDPVVKVLETAAYREMLMRARINSDLRAVLIAKAQNLDLEHRGAFYGVERALVSPATENEPAVWESDTRLRHRTQLAPEAFATTGPPGAYEFHVLSTDPAIRDVGVRRTIETDPAGDKHVQVRIAFLTDRDDGTPSQDLINKVIARLHEDDIKPLTDEILVMTPDQSTYDVVVNLALAEGPDQQAVVNAAQKSIADYCTSRHRIGMTVYRNGIIAAAKVSGVENVIVSTPMEDVVPSPDGAAYVTKITVAEAT